MENPGKVVRIVAITVSAIYALCLHFSGLTLQGGVKQGLLYVPTLIGFGVVAFDLWLWKLPWLLPISGRPRIGGTWVAQILPRQDSHIPEGGNRGPIDAALIIEQTYWSLAITVLTGESASHSTAAAIIANRDSRERHIVTYTYENLPKQGNRPRSMPHVGASQLFLAGKAPTVMTGFYWTDRFTVGDMELRQLNRKTDYMTVADVMLAATDAAQ
ncbi:hypothetical protein [Dactylosporangium sp. NPDC050588]|uniref:Cap15 family cyclic dinucleotide receptor domain-containing protein n=1 Tax=Dactylosporangium sp. NPDC050588 TaxID=3157211 RepID=UPI0033FED5E9